MYTQIYLYYNLYLCIRTHMFVTRIHEHMYISLTPSTQLLLFSLPLRSQEPVAEGTEKERLQTWNSG